MDRAKLLERIDALKITDVKTFYNEISAVIMDGIKNDWQPYSKKQANYLSMEFLIGRSFYNNLLSLGILEDVKKILAAKNFDINRFEEIEDAALGNGGLGRLAACFLDSAAGIGIPVYGFGIRYKYGLFKQIFIDGFQQELPDDWQSFGDPWSVRKEPEKRLIHFADMDVCAVPYDMPIIGEKINTLRLYQAEGCAAAEQISEYLYPPDDTDNGKILRLRQEYFFSAAAVGDLIDSFVSVHGKKFDRFSDFHVIQLNDTHPVLAIPEFIRLLTKQYKLTFPHAVKIAKRTFAYTNHTILPEALETWNASLLGKILPDIALILKKLNSFAKKEWQTLGCSDSEIAEMSIYKNKVFSMANTAVYTGFAVNGVAKIHSDIIKSSLFKTADKYYPAKLQNKTNGINHRRWLYLCNSELTALITEKLGDDWLRDLNGIERIKDYIGDVILLSRFAEVKNIKKRQLFGYIKAQEGIEILPNAIVYAQIKRLHEYKRQLMTAFALVELYQGIKSGKIKSFKPSVFIFGAKAAPGYRRAKGIIKYINEIAKKINSDSSVNSVLQVFFVQNYNVSYAEKIVAGADVSLQVSTAGLEASGTGNMKFMLNGSVTCGTMDGANIEIAEHAGKENNYIFGAAVDEINSLRNSGYAPAALVNADEAMKKAVMTLIDGTFTDGGTGYFKELYESLTQGASWHKPDHYFIFRDLPQYIESLLQINKDYGTLDFVKKQLLNTAGAAYFSSDRTIRQYAGEIWRI